MGWEGVGKERGRRGEGEGKEREGKGNKRSCFTERWGATLCINLVHSLGVCVGG